MRVIVEVRSEGDAHVRTGLPTRPICSRINQPDSSAEPSSHDMEVL
jgi:hypothetical protein